MSEADDSRGFEVSGVWGNPTPEEEAAILEALDEFLGREQQGGVGGTGASPMTWKNAPLFVEPIVRDTSSDTEKSSAGAMVVGVASPPRLRSSHFAS